MMASEAPVWIARDRAAGAKAAADAGAPVIVMDDGHQNPDVLKTPVADCRRWRDPRRRVALRRRQGVPAGPLREPFAAGLARADAVVLLLPADLRAARPDATCSFSRESRCFIARLAPVRRRRPGPQVGFRRHRQAVEDGARAAGRRLRPRRLRVPGRSPGPERGDCSPASPPAPGISAPASSPARRTGLACRRHGVSGSPSGPCARGSKTHRPLDLF